LDLLKQKQYNFSFLVGLAAAWKFAPMGAEAAKSYPLFRKRWMRPIYSAAAFGIAFYCAN